ncbi:MAG: hypothetical protein LUE12_01880 [Ruminococcus sp.]|nr:hypothetical protein [Ruminococcus sp.]
MERKELLRLVKSMDFEADYEKFYRFAQTYVFNLQRKCIDSSDSLFKVLKYCKDNYRSKNVSYRLGLSGKSANKIEPWCNFINSRSFELEKLSLEELNYVFGCCARLCKVKKSR